MLRFLLPWMRNRKLSLAYRVGMTAAMVGIVSYGILWRDLNAIPLALILAFVALIVHLSEKNVGTKQDREWEEAEEEFWRNYDDPFAFFSSDNEPASQPESPPDPLKVLGLEPGATKEEIRSAYRAICLACHPDTNGGGGNPTRFRSATEAYHALTR